MEGGQAEQAALYVEDVGENHPAFLLCRKFAEKVPTSSRKKSSKSFQLSGELPYKNFKFIPDHPLVGAKNVGNVSEWHLSNSVIYIWALEAFFFHLIPQVPCKECRKPDNVGADGWPANCRKVVALEGTYYIYSRRYRCKNCPAKQGKADTCFIGTDPDFIKLLPLWAQNLLPIHFTHKGAIHRTIRTLVFRDLTSAKSISDTRATLNELKHDEFYILEESYLSAAVSCKQRLGPFDRSGAPASFGKFEDPLGFNGAVPHPSYLSNIVVALSEGDRQVLLNVCKVIFFQ